MTTAPAPITEVLLVGRTIADMGHRPVCSCGWVGRVWPLGQQDTAVAALRIHVATH